MSAAGLKSPGPSHPNPPACAFTTAGRATSGYIGPIPHHSRRGPTDPDCHPAPHFGYHCHSDSNFFTHACPTANSHVGAGADTDSNTSANRDSTAHANADGDSNDLPYRYTVCIGNSCANAGAAPNRDAYPVPYSNANSGPYRNVNAVSYSYANSSPNCDSNTFTFPNSGSYSNASPIAHTDFGPNPNADAFTHANSGCNCDSDTCTNRDSQAYRNGDPNRRANSYTCTGTRSRRMPGRTSGHQFGLGGRLAKDQTYRCCPCTRDVNFEAIQFRGRHGANQRHRTETVSRNQRPRCRLRCQLDINVCLPIEEARVLDAHTVRFDRLASGGIH